MATTSQRGYGSAHQRERAKWKPIVDEGSGVCMETVCLMPSRVIEPGEAWDLAHGDTRYEYRGPAHVLCNRSEGGKRAHTIERWVI